MVQPRKRSPAKAKAKTAAKQSPASKKRAAPAKKQAEPARKNRAAPTRDEPAAPTPNEPAVVAPDEPAVVASDEPAVIAPDEPAVIAPDERVLAAIEEPGRGERIAELAADRARLAVDDGAPLTLGSITVPSGMLAIFDVSLMAYLPRAALDPMLICAPVPADRALPVTGVRVAAGRFAGAWDHVAIALGAAGPVVRARKLGGAAADFAQLICIDRAAIDHWQHEDSLDQLADFVFTGRDEAALAKALGARRLAAGDGHGWHDLPFAEAEALADRAAALKAEHKWRVTTELRPHSHHFDALAAARASPAGAGVLDVGGARALLFFTRWGEGVFPVYLDLDAGDQPVQVRIQLAAADPNATPGTVSRRPAW